ncbi:MAG: hypothetical protein BMS9Abin32_600 [Gammaproteobacteria bacterium]|nr:MAG: hypothetical protein BMS9Abin32_600 [Gammaproteobacteria bacterium]
MSAQQAFAEAVATITARIGGKALDDDLQAFLNENFPAGGEAFDELATLCRQGIDEGWLCAREHGGIKFGRIIEPGAATNGFSVDVVEMTDTAGPYHAHPLGEIDMIIPETAAAQFDGQGQGWLVCSADSAHYPTVTGGKAIVLYLLPDGEIDFTRPAP